MNFNQLYEELINVLAENSAAAPQYWTESELKSYLNRAQNQLIKESNYSSMFVTLQQAEKGAYYVPSDLLKFIQVYYKGKALDHKSIEYLDSVYGGTSRQAGLIGDGKDFSSGWRNEEGTPIHWYYENKKIKLYPVPESEDAAATTIREKFTHSSSAGAAVFAVYEPWNLPQDQNRVDFFVNGVYQNKDQWSIRNEYIIDFNGWTMLSDSECEVIYIPNSISLSDISKSEKYIRYVSAGQTKVMVPGGYVRGVGQLSVAINGVTQSSSAYSETANSYITLTSAPIIDSIVEITVTRSDPQENAAIRYIMKPTTMVNDSDSPEIDIEDAQWGIVFYAAYLALIKEGKMTQDLQKAAINKGLYEEIVSDVKSLTLPEMDMPAETSMPFFV